MKTTKPLSMHGFTIIEVMIVIVVMGFLLIAAIIFVSGDAQKANFTIAINAFKQQMEQIINETANGYYNNQNNFSCTDTTGTAPTTGAGSTPQAQNYGCVFLGKIVQFGPNNDASQFFVYPIAGSQYNLAGVPTNISTSFPKLISTGVNTYEYDAQSLEYGLTVTKMTAAPPANPNTTAVAFLAGDSQGNLASSSASCGGICSGAVPLSLYYDSNPTYKIGPPLIGASPSQLANDVCPPNNSTCANMPSTDLVATSEVSICATDGNKSGLIQIGGTGSLNVFLTIYDGTTC